VNSLCINGERLIPIELIDCAGLVSGAWQGRGLGNQFLSEINRANALIHVVDVSGSTDIEGKNVNTGTHDPTKDVRFLEKELNMWIIQILLKTWPKIVRNHELRKKDLILSLEEKLSGLSIEKRFIVEALGKTNLDKKKPSEWIDDDFHNFVDFIRKISKPMLIAANKIDLESSIENIKSLEKLDYIIVPCSTMAELVLRRAAEKKCIEYKPGDSQFNIISLKMDQNQIQGLKIIEEKILKKFGNTGVQEAINKAFYNLLGIIVVYTVEDHEKLCDHRGRILPDARIIKYGTTVRQLAYKIHTELGENFICGIDARSKRRLGENHILKHGDVISVVSAKKRK
jgi:ribosome-binding ATPase YchF (GTP1/OBG family)